MKVSQTIADHIRSVYFGGNWTDVSLHEKVNDLTWENAVQQVGAFHSIATLLFHMNYFVEATIRVLLGGPLDAKDIYSFDCPALSDEAAWEAFQRKIFGEAEQLAALVETLPDDTLSNSFVDEKYGSYYYCLQGLVEHCHYHLGQISMIKTMLESE